MPKIHLANGDQIECFTFKIDGLGVLYQVCPIGHKDYHAHMGWVPFSTVARIEHDPMPAGVVVEEETRLIFEEVTDENNLVQG